MSGFYFSQNAKEGDRIMEIQTIHLYRDTDRDIEPEKDDKVFRATDYFDRLIAKERRLLDTFSSIMNLGQDDIVKNDTAMQSYTLYFSEDDMEDAYVADMCLSPFKQHELDGISMPFLSIIQIHITTESLRRIKQNRGVDVIKQYQNDIAGILKGFKEIDQDIFIYRVYKILSAGDFAVVVRSRLPETSFKISTLIRCRMAGAKSDDGKFNASSWALYKTYTLLTFDEKLINKNLGEESNKSDEQKPQTGKFVIRGSYSCKYWAEETIKNTYQEEQVDSLNGRYDFTVQISENEFYEIYDCIKNYRKTEEIEPNILNGKKPTQVQSFLAALCQKQYLSYINIRYMIPKINNKYRKITSSETVIIDDNRDSKTKVPELKDQNTTYIEELKLQYEKLEEGYRKILNTEQNAEQYFKMLGKNIRACESLNNQPDTRIYVVGIGKQLNIVLCGMKVYLELYQRADKASKMNIARLTISYIRIAVHTIDNYLEHVRNNNLQSLQTPNYNLESNMGMEKIVIAYSEYLLNIIEFMSDKLKKGNNQRNFYPIVVPDLNQPDICVETLFMDGAGDDYAEEQEIRKNFDGNHYMMVIGSPTLSELGDIPIFTAMLFHELAHQIRYETRRERNQVIRCLVLREYANLIAHNIVNLAQHATGVQDEGGRLRRVLNKVIYEGLDKNVFTDSEIAENEWDTPLIYFKEFLKQYIKDFNFYVENKLDLANRTEKFIRDLFDVVEQTEGCRDYLIYLYDQFNNEEKEQNIIAYLEQLEISSFLVAAFGVAKECGIDLENDEIRKILDLNTGEVVKNQRDEIQFEPLWGELKKNASEKQDVLQKIKGIWESYVRFIEEWCSDADSGQNVINYKKIHTFEDHIYTEIFEMWKAENNKFNEDELDGYRDWTLLGRWLQIDNNQRKDTFWENISYSFGNIQLQYVDNVVSKYREITSDIAMYSMMNLSPFEYIKLMTTILPEDDLMNPFSVDRMVTVIAVMEEDTSLKAEDICTAFQEKEVEIVEKLRKFCDNLRKVDFREKVKAVLEKIITEITHAQNADSYIDISSVIENIEKLKAEVTDEDAEVFSLVTKITKALERLLLDNVNCILVLCESETLLKDYRKGASQMRKIMASIDINDFSAEKIKEMCNSSRQFFCERHYKTGYVNDEDLNKKSIEFLLDLYYKRKIRNSRWTGGLEDENNHKNNS